MDELKVVSAAILLEGNLIVSLKQPARHHNILQAMDKLGINKSDILEQGFLLNDGRFVMRKAAGMIALESGQIDKMISPPTLTSEDLW